MTTIAAASTSDSAYPRNDIRSMFNTGSATPTPIVAVAPIKTNGKEKEKEVIYLRYDDTNMKYIYLCTHCDQVWKTA